MQAKMSQKYAHHQPCWMMTPAPPGFMIGNLHFVAENAAVNALLSVLQLLLLQKHNDMQV